MLSFEGEMYLCDQYRYYSILHDSVIYDFSFLSPADGYLLGRGCVFRIRNNIPELFLKDPLLASGRRIAAISEDELIIAGLKGLILRYHAGRLTRIQSGCKDDLTEILVQEEEIWIGGKNGRLLYSGPRQFPPLKEAITGFSPQNLIAYGVRKDNEYGVAIADFNGDGLKDIYASCIFIPNRLYINRMASKDRINYGEGFSEEADRRGATGSFITTIPVSTSDLKMGVNAVDVDNDGDKDLYLNYLNSRNRFLINNGNGFFRNVSSQDGRACDDVDRSNASDFADVDLDGDIDLFVTSENSSNKLYLNDGTGHFTDVTQQAGLMSNGGGMCASFSDINNDGLPDLVVSFWYPGNKVYLNRTVNNEVRFEDFTPATDLGKAESGRSNAVVFADVNNDGTPDLFIANRNIASRLYLNDGKGHMKDHSTHYFEDLPTLTNGAVFADFDLDGFLDLYLTNVGENTFFRNVGGTRFEKATARFGVENTGYGTGSGAADIDNDGDIDLYAACYINGDSKLFLNISGAKNSVSFHLSGTKSNRDAVGAKVWLFEESPGRALLVGYREITAGGGYCSGGVGDLVFGLVSGRKYHALIKFPCSKDTLKINGIKIGGVYFIAEEKGWKKDRTLAGKAVTRFFSDREKQPEIMKVMLVFSFLLVYLIRSKRISRKIRLLRWGGSIVIFSIFLLVNQRYLYNAFEFPYFISVLVSGGLLAILHLYIIQILVKSHAMHEQHELREKLSRDLHDDLASTLGSISIYSETLKSMEDTGKIDHLKLSVKIASLTQDAMRSISDIIWMTSPRNDSLQGLMSKTSNYMMEVLTDNQVRFVSSVNLPESVIRLSEKVRNDAFLILKEALHNIIRHSGASEVTFYSSLVRGECSILLNDNGKGFDQKEVLSPGHRPLGGNGLVNMQKRADDSGIGLVLETEPGKGTSVKLLIKLS
jgi:anti-sigma regulatory factor (Ser/Thr protein kinase)